MLYRVPPKEGDERHTIQGGLVVGTVIVDANDAAEVEAAAKAGFAPLAETLEAIEVAKLTGDDNSRKPKK